MKNRMHLIVALILIISASAGADHQAGHCVVSDSHGDIRQGSLLSQALDVNCREITFAVNQVDPLKAPLAISSGTTLKGKAGIVLQLDPALILPRDFRCLLHIYKRNLNTGAVVSDIEIVNPRGDGICVDANPAGAILHASQIKNVTIRANRGIYFNTSSDNKVEDSIIVGEGALHDEAIHIEARGNIVLRGRIENFNNGVVATGHNTDTVIVSEVNFFRIQNKPIVYARTVDYRPEQLRSAFVTNDQFSMTGVIKNLATLIEVYKVSPDHHDYEYKLTLPAGAFLASGPTSGLGDKKRFLHTLLVADGLLAGNDFIAMSARIYTPPNFRTQTEFSDIYESANEDPIIGGLACADAEWFWQSYDDRNNHSADVAMKAWDFDYDGDGINNSCIAARCDDPLKAEDRDRNCVLDVRDGETDPDDFYHQYDFDCDTHPDHFARRGGAPVDNCPNTSFPAASRGVAVGVRQPMSADCTNAPAEAILDATFESYNRDQADTDNDGIGDACEAVVGGDMDGDGIANGVDNCPSISNRNQRNSDGAGDGDACEQLPVAVRPPAATPDDADGDRALNLADNCPYVANANQLDFDGDSVGDDCDFDDDNDGLADSEEDPINGTDPQNPDSDSDGICDGPGWGFQGISCVKPLDNCPLKANREQFDRDEDAIGDACENTATGDADGDGFADIADNCRMISNVSQADIDNDGVGNPCDGDDDNDGLDDATESGIFDPKLRTNPAHRMDQDRDVDRDLSVDGIDTCINISNPAENNAYRADRSQYPISCGGYDLHDLDNDTILDNRDNCDFIPNRDQRDLDEDGQGDACDLDDDNDDNSNATADECFDYLVSFNFLNAVVVRNREGCMQVPRAICRTCDFDESANIRLHAWDPNSDHEEGNIFDFADDKCDGNGLGFGLARTMMSCVVSDPCPEFFNADGNSACTAGAGPPLPGISPIDGDGDGVNDVSDNCPADFNPGQEDQDADGVGDSCDNCRINANLSQNDKDGDGLGDTCDLAPNVPVASKLQGGGCQLDPTSKADPLFFALIALANGLLITVRRRSLKHL